MEFLIKTAFFQIISHGFINGKSTGDTYFIANNCIRDSLDQNNKVIRIFLDNKKLLTR